MSKRIEYGELKKHDLARTTIEIRADLMERINRLRNGRSWSLFLEEVDQRLSTPSPKHTA